MAESNRKHRVSVSGPVLKVSLFDQVMSTLQTMLFFLVAIVVVLYGLWLFHKPPTMQVMVPVEYVPSPGGVPDGSLEESLDIQSSEDLAADASMVDQPTNESANIEEMLDHVVEVSDQAAEMTGNQFRQEVTTGGRPGRIEGTGNRRARGQGDGERGFPRETRWMVRWADDSSPDMYAAQLEYFGIELGALTRDGKLIYLSNLTAERPTARTVTSGADEKRLYMTWQAGERQKADLALFEKAGIKLDKVTLFHFYPAQTEQQLAQLEVSYANKQPQYIRKTYYVVQRERNGYKLVVTRQLYF